MIPPGYSIPGQVDCSILHTAFCSFYPGHTLWFLSRARKQKLDACLARSKTDRSDRTRRHAEDNYLNRQRQIGQFAR
jgi:hypothetical protein